MCTNEKAMQIVLQHLTVTVWHAVKSFDVVLTWFHTLKTHAHANFL